MRVAVTGASGFIGRLVCQRLQSRDTAVLRIVRPSRAQDTVESDVLCVDLQSDGALRHEGIPEIDLVVHLAAVLPMRFEGDDADRSAAANLAIDRAVFEWSQRLGVGIVYASTTSVYGLGDGAYKDENAVCRPIGPYAAAKLRSEREGFERFRSASLRFVALRVNAPYGPSQSSRTVLQYFIDRARQNEPLRYHGTGSRQQDFTHVEDVAEAVVAAVGSGRSGTFNVSGGRPVTMKALAEMVIANVPGSSSYVEPSGQPDPQEGATALFCIDKARIELGWTPTHSLEHGIAEVVRWYEGPRREVIGR